MNKSDPDINKQAIQLQGRFGKLFLDYTGCPRGPMGRACEPIEKEVFEMPVITDTDGGKQRRTSRLRWKSCARWTGSRSM